MTVPSDSRVVRAVDGSWMRRTNLSVVLASIIDSGAISRAALANGTGLNKATISSLTEELLRLGWVRAAGHDQGAVGRPRELLEPDPGLGVLVGAEINVDYLAVLVTDSRGTERALVKQMEDVGALAPEEAIAQLPALIERALDQAGVAWSEVRGVGLGLPGVVDETRRLLVAANLGWRDVEASAMIERHLGERLAPGAPVVMENEANLGAVAEQTYGVGGSLKNFVFLSGQLGVGGGVVVGGELFRGTHGAAGELGHVTVDPAGDRCVCGKSGCWQVFVGRGAILDNYDLTAERRPTTAIELLLAAEEDDPAAVRAVAQLDRYLAIGIGNLVEMYDPEAVVLGGFYATMYAGRVGQLRQGVGDWVMDSVGRELAIELASHGQDACLWGGAGAVLRWLIADPRAVADGRTGA